MAEVVMVVKTVDESATRDGLVCCRKFDQDWPAMSVQVVATERDVDVRDRAASSLSALARPAPERSARAR